MTTLSRRELFTTSTALWLTGPVALSFSQTTKPGQYVNEPSIEPGVSRYFPTADPKDVENLVRFAHFDVDKVRAIVTDRPALSKASWDWGFGDWESALGAASHMGRRDIAEILIDHGARPNLFTFAMLGQLEPVKAIIAANPGIQKIHGPHGITLLKHAQNGGDDAKSVVEYLESLGDAGIGQTSLALDDDAKQMYVGAYEINAPDEHTLNVSIMNNGGLGIARGERIPRFLHSIGEHSFAPSGAPDVHIQFAIDTKTARSLTIHDGELIVTARRIK